MKHALVSAVDLRREERRLDVFNRLSEILAELRVELPRAKKSFAEYVNGYAQAVEDVRTGFPKDGYLEELKPGPSLPTEARVPEDEYQALYDFFVSEDCGGGAYDALDSKKVTRISKLCENFTRAARESALATGETEE